MTTTRTPSDTETRVRRDLDGDGDLEVADARSTRAERHTGTRRRFEGDRVGTAAASVAAATRGLVRLIRLAAAVVAGVIVLGILFVVLEANPDNAIVSAVDDVARALVGPFDGMFDLDDAKTTIAVNWGIAALAYLILGALIAWLVALIGTAGLRSRRA